MTDITPKRRLFQYSLRTLLIIVTLCAVACSLLAAKRQQVKRQREAAAAIEKLGGRVVWSEPSELSSLWGPPGEDAFFQTVRKVSFDKVTDVDSEYFEVLNQLEDLDIANSKVTDSGLEHLKGLNHLKCMHIWNTKATKEGTRKLEAALPNCYFDHGK